MEPCRVRWLLFLASVLIVAASSLAEEAISVTVDATRTQQRLLHAHLVMPVKPGASDALLPEMDSRRARARWTHRKSDGPQIRGRRADHSVAA